MTTAATRPRLCIFCDGPNPAYALRGYAVHDGDAWRISAGCAAHAVAATQRAEGHAALGAPVVELPTVDGLVRWQQPPSPPLPPTLAELRRAAAAVHPDRGGDPAEFRRRYAAYIAEKRRAE